MATRGAAIMFMALGSLILMGVSAYFFSNDLSGHGWLFFLTGLFGWLMFIGTVLADTQRAVKSDGLP